MSQNQIPIQEQSYYLITRLSDFCQKFQKMSKTYEINLFLDSENISLETGLRAKVIKFKEDLGQIKNDEVLVIKLASEPINNKVKIDSIYYPTEYTLNKLVIEEVTAKSLKIKNENLISYQNLIPRTVSFLPIALACQAKCKFCFSKASASSEQNTAPLDLLKVEKILKEGKKAGAERIVFTGGGEPGLYRFDRLCSLIALARNHYNKIVMISNGYFISNLKTEQERIQKLQDLAKSGLTLLAISRHHHNEAKNEEIMNLGTKTDLIIEALSKANIKSLQLRLICLLQKEGIASEKDMADYLDWVVSKGIKEVCFKELYVSTSSESFYYEKDANQFSYKHQISIDKVITFLTSNGFNQIASLPWGAPIFKGQWKGQDIKIATYFEPSLFWERTNGIARSWNVMADGKCLVSLEDRESEIFNK